jgi:hypothetical protein
LQKKKIVTIVADAKPINACRGLFKGLEIVPLPSDYLFSLTNFTVNNQKNFDKLQLYLAAISKIKTIFIDQFPTFQCL